MISQSQQQNNAAAAAPGGGVHGAAAAEGEAQQQRTLPIIIKADVQGSAEALKDAVAHMATEHIRVQVGLNCCSGCLFLFRGGGLGLLCPTWQQSTFTLCSWVA
jgi:hypothetical protein